MTTRKSAGANWVVMCILCTLYTFFHPIWYWLAADGDTAGDRAEDYELYFHIGWVTAGVCLISAVAVTLTHTWSTAWFVPVGFAGIYFIEAPAFWLRDNISSRRHSDMAEQ